MLIRPDFHTLLSRSPLVHSSRIMKPKSLAKTLAACAKEILGTAQSVGCTVDGQNPHDIIEGIDDGES